MCVLSISCRPPRLPPMTGAPASWEVLWALALEPPQQMFCLRWQPYEDVHTLDTNPWVLASQDLFCCLL